MLNGHQALPESLDFEGATERFKAQNENLGFALGIVVVALRGQTKAKSVRKEGQGSGEGHDQRLPGRCLAREGEAGSSCQCFAQRLVGQ